MTRNFSTLKLIGTEWKPGNGAEGSCRVSLCKHRRYCLFLLSWELANKKEPNENEKFWVDGREGWGINKIHLFESRPLSRCQLDRIVQKKIVWQKKNILRHFRSIPSDLIAIVLHYKTQLTLILSSLLKSDKLKVAKRKTFPFCPTGSQLRALIWCRFRRQNGSSGVFGAEREKLKWPISSDERP